MTTTQTNYQQQAIEALAKCGTTLTLKLSNTKAPLWDNTGSHDHYIVTLKNVSGKYSFSFWQSIKGTENQETPSAYDVIACLEWNTPESFEEFCSDMGYSTDSIKDKKTWKACLVMTRNLNKIFNESQINLLSEIR